MTDTTCPAPECERTIGGDLTCCLTHWKKLPYRLRTQLSGGQTPDDRWLSKADRIWRGISDPTLKENR